MDSEVSSLADTGKVEDTKDVIRRQTHNTLTVQQDKQWPIKHYTEN